MSLDLAVEFVQINSNGHESYIRNDFVHPTMAESIIVQPIFDFREGPLCLDRTICSLDNALFARDVFMRFFTKLFEGWRKFNGLRRDLLRA